MLSRIPDRYFEIAGTVFGLLASLTIASQVYKEFTTDTPSSLSLVYAAGFLVIFVFWTFYGIRFRRTAMWLTNGVAACVQTLLLAAIFMK